MKTFLATFLSITLFFIPAANALGDDYYFPRADRMPLDSYVNNASAIVVGAADNMKVTASVGTMVYRDFVIRIARVLKGDIGLRDINAEISDYEYQKWKQVIRSNPSKECIFFLTKGSMKKGYWYALNCSPVEKETEIASLVKNQQVDIRNSATEEASLRRFVEKLCGVLEQDNFEEFKRLIKMDGNSEPGRINYVAAATKNAFKMMKSIHRSRNYRKIFKDTYRDQLYDISRGHFLLYSGEFKPVEKVGDQYVIDIGSDADAELELSSGKWFIKEIHLSK